MGPTAARCACRDEPRPLQGSVFFAHAKRGDVDAVVERLERLAADPRGEERGDVLGEQHRPGSGTGDLQIERARGRLAARAAEPPDPLQLALEAAGGEPARRYDGLVGEARGANAPAPRSRARSCERVLE